MDKKITDFIRKQTTATICCLDDKKDPYCFSVFFAFDEESKMLFFKSSSNSAHADYLLHNRVIAGTILPDKLKLLIIQGIQFTGELLDKNDPLAKKAFQKYHGRFPFALAMAGDVYAIELSAIKMTDNSGGFGKKFLWKRSEEEKLVAG